MVFKSRYKSQKNEMTYTRPNYEGKNTKRLPNSKNKRQRLCNQEVRNSKLYDQDGSK